MTHSACSEGKAHVVEFSLDDSGGGEAFVSSQPSSLTSSGRGGLLSSARRVNKPSRVVHAAGAPEDREHFPVAPTLTGRLRHKSDPGVLISHSAPTRASMEMLADTPLRPNYNRKSPTITATLRPPYSPPRTPQPQTCTLPAVEPTPLPPSSVARPSTASASRSSSLRTPRPTEELMPSHPPSTRHRTSTASSPVYEPIVVSSSFATAAASPVAVASPVALASPSEAKSPNKHSLALSDEADVCCICLEEYNDDNPMFRGVCQHHFHLSCLMEWKQRSAACPMCCAETLRGVGDLDASQPTVPVDPAEVARQRAIAERDLAMAQKLQHKYLRQAQRRGSRDAHAAHAVRLSQALSNSSSASRAPVRVAEVERQLSSAYETSGAGQPPQPAGLVRMPPPRRSRRGEQATPPLAERTSTRNVASARARSTPPPSQTATHSSRRSRTKSQAGCCAM